MHTHILPYIHMLRKEKNGVQNRCDFFMLKYNQWEDAELASYYYKENRIFIRSGSQQSDESILVPNFILSSRLQSVMYGTSPTKSHPSPPCSEVHLSCCGRGRGLEKQGQVMAVQCRGGSLPPLLFHVSEGVMNPLIHSFLI